MAVYSFPRDRMTFRKRVNYVLDRVYHAVGVVVCTFLAVLTAAWLMGMIQVKTFCGNRVCAIVWTR